MFCVLEVHFILRMPVSHSLLTCVLSCCGEVDMHVHTCTHAHIFKSVKENLQPLCTKNTEELGNEYHDQ